MDVTTISKIELGKSKPSIGTLENMGEKLGFKIELNFVEA